MQHLVYLLRNVCLPNWQKANTAYLLNKQSHFPNRIVYIKNNVHIFVGMRGPPGPGGRKPEMVEDPGPYGTPIPQYAQNKDDWIPQNYLEKGKDLKEYVF